MATIVTINNTDAPKDSRAVINTNFSNLNTDKIEIASVPVKATKAENVAGTDDAKFLTALSNVPAFYSFIQRQAIINGGMEISQENGTNTENLVKDVANYACDLISVIPTGTAVSAGTQAQISNSTIGTSGYALKLAGVTITGAGTIKKRYRIESADAVKYKNKSASFSMLELQDTGGSLNYTIQINKANATDNFAGGVTQIAISGNLAVASATGTKIVLENVSMGDCSKGIEICVTIPCGAITTKNFETTEWQMNVGAVVLPFVCGSRAEELLKVMRYLFSLKSDVAYQPIAMGIAASTTAGTIPVFLPVKLRTNPSLIATASDWVISDSAANFDVTVLGLITGYNGTQSLYLSVTVASGLIAKEPLFFVGDGTVGRTLVLDARFTA